MEIEYTVQAEGDLKYWQRTNNKTILKKIRALLENILETPYSGIGKPEALKHELSGKWSRRITKSDRLVYQIVGNKLYIFSLQGHYK
ncbi:MAG TPA: Txe/YoeB family addiction module toxin [Prolixibacteraceae bacterium]|nr:Txe/YoeB family addiction module toxin [Prolixibacteraceae bacterium]